MFDVGKPVKILHLAERLIELSGFWPYEDIDIANTGLRPWEKLYEEILGDKPPHNEKIMVAKDDCLAFPVVHKKAIVLETSAVRGKNNAKMVRLLKNLVAEFITQIQTMRRWISRWKGGAEEVKVS